MKDSQLKRRPNLTFPTLEKLHTGLAQFLNLKQDSYLRSYEAFVEYFKPLTLITSQNLIIGSHFTYGWMPTILNLGEGDLSAAADLLTRVKSGKRLTKAELELIKKIVNNSVVGMSKLLHFVSPHTYPIWDSHIARYVSTERLGYHWMKDIDLYLDYTTECVHLSQDLDFTPIHEQIIKQVGYSMSRLRTLELAMFTMARARFGKDQDVIR